MKISIISFLLILTTQLNAQSIKQFKWLEGTWERQNVRDGQSAFETWDLKKQQLDGVGVSLKGTDTVFTEKLQIVIKDQKLYYVASPSQNSAPTFFEITAVSKNGFVSENPSHDFPKKIEYQLEGNKLTATISGDGKAIPFVFMKK